MARDQVLEDLKHGRARAKFTIAHELGHFFLGHRGRRARNKDKDNYSTPQQRLDEVEANKFASYLLVPTSLAMDASSAQDIADKFQVSTEAAEIAFERVQREQRRLTGEKRQSPAVVVSFLEEMRRRGLKVNSIPEKSKT